MKTIDEIQQEYPLHWHVWHNNLEALQLAVNNEKIDKEQIDPRGCTPLMLAVKLAHLQCVKCLLDAKCDATYEYDGWSIVQEAVCTGNEDILTAILEVRDLQRHVQRVQDVPKLLQHLLDAPDFYIEMKWEFTSWVPLMSRLCPSDTYRVYKRGANVRIDTTLLGFDNNTWQRGYRSYIFKGLKDSATMIEIDHDTNEVMMEQMSHEVGDILSVSLPIGMAKARLNAPVVSNNIEVEKISFERNKSGIWGWRSEKSELINGYNCKVYGASNVEFVSKTRMDHLTDEQIKAKTSKTPFHNFLGITETGDELNNSNTATDNCTENSNVVANANTNANAESTQNGIAAAAAAAAVSETTNNLDDNSETNSNTPKHTISVEEYFSADVDLNGREIGNPKKINTKIQRFKANLWLCEDYPIRLQEQVLPILDLMSTMARPHVSKLKDFITMQLPAGFPVKIEIPLFHVLNACITFGNVFGMTTPVQHVSTINEDDRITCIVDDRCFEIPIHYRDKDSNTRQMQMSMDEDDYLQYAIEQSLVDTTITEDNSSDKVDIWEALRGQSTQNDFLSDEDEQLQRVLQESLYSAHSLTATSNNIGSGSNQRNDSNVQKDAANETEDDGAYDNIDPDLALALRLSQEEQQQYELERQREQEMVEQALKLSLQDH